MNDNIIASEAIYGFMAWLTSRPEVTTLSASHNAAPAADLVKKWCEINNLAPPREGIYPTNITYPEPI